MTLNETLVRRHFTEYRDGGYSTQNIIFPPKAKSSNKLPHLTLKMQNAEISSLSEDSNVKEAKALCSLVLILKAISHIPCKNME